MGEALRSLHDDFEMLSIAKGKARINNLTLHLYRDNLQTLVITAKQTEVNLTNSDARFAGASIKDVITGRDVSSKKIIWNQRQSRFEIPGKYMARSTKGQAVGRGLYVDLDFKLTAI